LTWSALKTAAQRKESNLRINQLATKEIDIMIVLWLKLQSFVSFVMVNVIGP